MGKQKKFRGQFAHYLEMVYFCATKKELAEHFDASLHIEQ
jgi:hypothetical protein